jgi:DNA-binding response OmpR family regulator
VDKLIDIIWADEFDLNPDIAHLKSLIYRLRKKVPGLLIKNIYGMGYVHD